jgi:hypothetical protein
MQILPDVTATTVSIWVAIASSVISGIVGVVVTLVYSHLYEKRRMKLDVLKRFAAYRYDTGGVEFVKAMNEIFIVFQDSRKVMQALADFHRFASPDDWRDSLIRLFKAMCGDAGVRVDFNDSFFLKPYIPKPKILKDELPQAIASSIESGSSALGPAQNYQREKDEKPAQLDDIKGG